MSLLKNGTVSDLNALICSYSKAFLSSLLLLTLATSCQYFETTKIDSETFYEQEIETISWDDVDQYPHFNSCDESESKEGQRNCFTTELSKLLLQQLSKSEISSIDPLNHRLELEIFVSEQGEITIRNNAIDSLLQSRLPGLNSELNKALENAPKVSPALKRGIPVKTSFTLPVLLKSKE